MQAHVAQWHIARVHGAEMVARHPAYRDNDNCTVRALRDTFDIELITAYEHMKAHGRKHGRRATWDQYRNCLLYTSPSPRDATLSRMPSSA